MSHLRRLWAGMLTRTTGDDPGTNSRIALTIDGTQLTFPADTAQEDQERGQANLYEVAVADRNIVPENLNDTSILLTILDDDAWRPEHFVVWGERFTGGSIVPLAIETGIGAQLSTDPGEGAATLRLRLAALGSRDMPINRILLMMTTANTTDAGTDSDINLRIADRAGRLVVNFTIPDSSQDDQQRGQANFYFVPVRSSFARSGLADASIRLSIRGDDAWLPASIFLFGLDDATGRPEQLVPLVNVRNWTLDQLSSDPDEGRIFETLPLL